MKTGCYANCGIRIFGRGIVGRCDCYESAQRSLTAARSFAGSGSGAWSVLRRLDARFPRFAPAGWPYTRSERDSKPASYTCFAISGEVQWPPSRSHTLTILWRASAVKPGLSSFWKKTHPFKSLPGGIDHISPICSDRLRRLLYPPRARRKDPTSSMRPSIH